jgi:TrmH family RNA methyltransferase
MITSTKNPRIVEARKLTQRKHRLRQNRFLVEGLQLLAMAVQAARPPDANFRIKPLEVFYSEVFFTGETAPRLLAQLTEAGAQAISVAPKVMDSLSERDTSQGLATTFALRELEHSINELEQLISQPPHLPISPPLNLPTPRAEPRDEASPAPLPPRSSVSLLLILDKLQDPGNLGTLIRTADAVGARAVILLEPCVDPFDPKTVRGTMGSIFTTPFARTKKPDELWPRLTKRGYRLVGADASRGQPTWQSEVLMGPVALVLGNEARGLSHELHPHLTDYVSLPLYGQAESLNVAVAGGVLMYEWLRVNRTTD